MAPVLLSGLKRIGSDSLWDEVGVKLAPPDLGPEARLSLLTTPPDVRVIRGSLTGNWKSGARRLIRGVNVTEVGANTTSPPSAPLAGYNLRRRLELGTRRSDIEKGVWLRADCCKRWWWW